MGWLRVGDKGWFTLLHPTLLFPTLPYPTLLYPTLRHPTLLYALPELFRLRQIKREIEPRPLFQFRRNLQLATHRADQLLAN